MTAVVTRQHGSCAVEELELVAPGRTDVVVRIEASGICHSDVSVLTGDLPGPLPVVLGHEGAGVVAEVGADVTTVRPGDRVVLSAIPTCGRCYFCARGEPVLCARAEDIRVAGFRDGASRSAAPPGWARSLTPSSCRSWRPCRSAPTAGRTARAARVRGRHWHRLGDQPGIDRAG